MKLYKVGKAVNVVLIAAAAVTVLLGVSLTVNYSAFKNLKVADASALGTALMVTGIIFLTLSIAALIVVRYLEKKISVITTNFGVHIGMIATGILSVNLFYLAGGICGWVFDRRTNATERIDN